VADINGDGRVNGDEDGWEDFFENRAGQSVADDPLVMHSRLESFRTDSQRTYSGSYGGYGSLCDVGHQGLLHDKEFGPAATGLVHNRARTLNPHLGRFNQRDPLGYPDGMNGYEYEGSSPIGRLDPGGRKWKIKRKNAKSTALATPSVGDTFDDLAKMLTLNSDELLDWLTWECKRRPRFDMPEGGLGAIAVNRSIKQCCTFRVPNTVVYHLGDSHNWNAWWDLDNWTSVFADFRDWQKASVKRHKKRGYTTVIKVMATNKNIKDALKHQTIDKHLQKYFFYGHGDTGGSGTINARNGRGVPPGQYTTYGLGRMELRACGSLAPGNGSIWYKKDGKVVQLTKVGDKDNTLWRLNVSPRGKIVGYDDDVNATNHKQHEREYSGLYKP
jgi:RHS repeat-associated protein